MVRLAQMLAQEGGRPHGGVIPIVSRVVIDDRVNEAVNRPLHGGWPTAPGSIQKTLCGRQGAPPLKPTDPVVEGLSADLDMFGYLLDGFAVIQQHQGQSTPILPEILGHVQKALTLVPLPGTQCDY